ncbi:MAG: hypothetical protein H6732_11700 [Alphaproteobacteria bacterium]|nr:hypothetical protein [Alphaproteobacteria bacterium]
MSPVPSSLAGHAVLEAVTVPEPGAWFLTDGRDGEAWIWARVVGAFEGGRGEGDLEALELARERLAHLDHPAVPRPVGLDEDEGVLLLAAPPGVPLTRLLEARQDPAFVMTPGTLLDLGLQLADLVVHAHERGRPHGHLSPDVLWLTPTGRLVVWGFGAGPDHPGAARWWSPERARGRRASGDADQWAVGAVLAALVTGRLPWRGDDPVSEARIGDSSHLSGPVSEQWKPLGRLVERALQAEPRDRFSSVHPVRQALEAMWQRVGQPSDLAAMGAELDRRHGVRPAVSQPDDADEVDTPPGVLDPGVDAGGVEVDALDAGPARPLDPLDAPAVPVLPADGPPTAVSDGPPPLDALAGTFAGPLHGATLEADDPTDRLTTPTRVPSAEEREALRGGPVMASLPTPSGPPSGPGLEPPSLGDVAVAERPGPPPGEPLAWYEQLGILRIAPWTVGALAVLLVLYLLRMWVG